MSAVTPTPERRASDSTAKLYAALVKAQSEATPVVKDSKNPHFGYGYAKSETIIGEAKGYLNQNGLALFPTSMEEVLPRPSYGEAEQKSFHIARATSMRCHFKLVHTSGEWEAFGPRDYPVTPEKGAIRAAWAASNTLALAYIYRDVLGLPRLSEEEFRALEKEQREEAARTANASVKPAAPAPAPAPAPNQAGSVGSVSFEPKGAGDRKTDEEKRKTGETIVNEMSALLDEGAKRRAKPCGACGAAAYNETDTGTGEVVVICERGHKNGQPRTGETITLDSCLAEATKLRAWQKQKEEEETAKSERSIREAGERKKAAAAPMSASVPLPTTAALAKDTGSAASAPVSATPNMATTPQVPPASTPPTGTATNGDDELHGRRSSMLKYLADARKSALANGLTSADFKARCDKIAPGVHGEGRFVAEALTDDALKAFGALYHPDKKALVALATK